jgi:hypothetical protein
MLLLVSKVHAESCSIPSDVTVVGHNLVGTFDVHVSHKKKKTLNLFVENVMFPNNQCPGDVYTGSVSLWQSLYQDYINAGMTENNVQILASSISGTQSSGIYIRKTVNACGYNGLNKTITCSGSTNQGQKGVMAHENMHGWEFQFLNDSTGIQFYLAFAYFANKVYAAEQANGGSISGTYKQQPWTLNYLTYGLQNEAEWGSEVFADWLLGTANHAVWPYIDANEHELVTYFNCLWKTDTTPTKCTLALSPPVTFASSDPTLNPPESVTSNVNTPSGPKKVTFSQAQSQSIWNVCFNPYKHSASQNDYNKLQAIIDDVAPDLPDNAAYNYKLMYADANHDNVIDWFCEYSGPVPNVGNGQYLWNKQNKYGTYTFVISGKGPSDYVEYKQDPFLNIPSMANGAIAQPQFREWQGQFGSANGAKQFAGYTVYPWYPIFASQIGSQPQSPSNFSGSFAVNNWQEGSNAPINLVNTSGAPQSVSLSNYRPWRVSGATFIFDSASEDGLVTFNYTLSGATSECPGMFVSGKNMTVLNNAQGTGSFFVFKGESFGFSLNGQQKPNDFGCISQGEQVSMTITSFNFKQFDVQ